MWWLLPVCLLVLLTNQTLAQVTGLNATEAATPTIPLFRTKSGGRNSKVRIESTETGWVEAPPSQTQGQDIGSIIASLTELTIPDDTVRATSDFRVHDESSETGFGTQFTRLKQTKTPITTTEANVLLPTLITNNGQVLTPTIPTRVIIGSQTLAPGGETATIGEGDGATKVHLDPSGSPVVVVGDLTTTAQLSSAPSQVFTMGQLTATAVASDLQLVMGSSTLSMGQRITVSGTVIALTTDTGGATVLILGGSTSTLASSAPSQGPEVSTLVVDGTTKYIIDSQTLAPDHPITLDGTPISIRTGGSSTILVIGDATTILNKPTASDFTITSGFSAATPGTLDQSRADAAPTTSKSGATALSGRRSFVGTILLALSLAALDLG